MTTDNPRPASHNTASADEADAVQWSARNVGGKPQWTTWHWVDEGEVTVCGRRVPRLRWRMAFSTRAERVTCRRCRKWLDSRRKGEVVSDE